MGDRETWEYPFTEARLDVQNDARLLQPGRFAKLTGVDGREEGNLRRFPGWEHIGRTINTAGHTLGTASGLNRWWSFSLQLAPQSRTIVRGLLFLANDGVNDVIRAYVTTEKDGTVTDRGTITLIAVTAGIEDLDVATDHQLLYMTGRNSSGDAIELLGRFRLFGGVLGAEAEDWSPEWVDAPTFFDLDTTHGGSNLPPDGYLESDNQDQTDQYGFAVRLVFPEQGYVMPVSLPTVRSTSDGSANIPNSRWWMALSSVMFNDQAELGRLGRIFSSCKLQVLRTAAERYIGVIGDESGEKAEANARGQLFLEAEFVIPRSTGSRSGRATLVSSTTFEDTSVAFGSHSVGETIYVAAPTRERESGSDHRVWFVHRRRISALADLSPGVRFTLDEAVPTGGLTLPAANGVGYWVSNESEEETAADFNFTLADVGPTPATEAPVSSSHVTSGFKARPGTADVVADTPQGLPDSALALQPRVDRIDFSVFRDSPPITRRIEAFNGLLVRTVEPSGATDSQGQPIETVYWSFTDRPGKGLISILARRRITDLQRQVEDFVTAPPFLVVVLSNGFLRLHRSGAELTVDDFHNRFGVQTGTLPLAIGTAVYCVSPHGLIVLDAASGNVDIVAVTAPYFREPARWRNSLGAVELGYDNDTGCLVAFNKTLKEALVLWVATGNMTHLKDIPYDRLITSPNLNGKGTERLYWILESTGEIFEIDGDRSSTDGITTLSGTSDVGNLGGTTTATAANKLIDTTVGNTFGDSVVGHFVHVRDASNVWNRAKITAKDSATQLSLDTDIATATGLQYVIGAVPMEVAAWPLRKPSQDPTSQVLFDLFRVKKTTGMGIVQAEENNSLVSPETKEDIQYHVYDRSLTSPATRAPATLSTTDNATTFADIERNGALLVPGFAVYSPRIDLKLVGQIVEGWVEDSIIDTVRQTS